MSDAIDTYGYSVGDEIFVFNSKYGVLSLRPGTVKSITKTGRINVELGNGFSKQYLRGNEVGSGWYGSHIERKEEQDKKVVFYRKAVRNQAREVEFNDLRNKMTGKLAGKTQIHMLERMLELANEYEHDE